MKNNRGFTLIEMLFVLGLMAALAGMTGSSVSELDDRSRARVTHERLQLIRTAIMGDKPGAPSFVRDMGRFPSLKLPDGTDRERGRRVE